MVLAGLAGSVAHCTFMCGPFVLAQIGARLQRIPATQLCEQARLRHALLAPYHLGRITTYAMLGAGAAWLGQAAGSWLGSASSWLLLAGAALFILQAASRLFPQWRLGGTWSAGSSSWLRPIRQAASRLDVTRPGGALLLGLALGGLPCALLYSAVAVAAAAGNPAGGAIMLAAFGLGTVPALVLVGIAGHRAGQLWNGAVARLAPVLLLGNASMLIVMAARGFAV